MRFRRLRRRWVTTAESSSVGRVNVPAPRLKGDPPAASRGGRPASCSAPTPVSVDGQWERGLSAGGTSGVQFADVEVDIETGVTRVKKIVCVQDCGLILDLLTAETQCYGGIISGLNYALFENRILDRNTATHGEPEHGVLPARRACRTSRRSMSCSMDQPERGVIGIGEPPTIATAAAIANAIRNATGVHGAQHPDHARQAAQRAAAQGGRHELKAFPTSTPRTRRKPSRRSAPSAAFLPIAGGMDLLGLMKDYIAQPERAGQPEGPATRQITGAGATGGLTASAPAVELARRRRTPGRPAALPGARRRRPTRSARRRSATWARSAAT